MVAASGSVSHKLFVSFPSKSGNKIKASYIIGSPDVSGIKFFTEALQVVKIASDILEDQASYSLQVGDKKYFNATIDPL